MKLTQNEFNEVIDLLVDVGISITVRKIVANTAMNNSKSEINEQNAKEKYKNTIASLYKKYNNTIVSFDSDNIYEKAMYWMNRRGGRNQFDGVNGVYKILLTINGGMNIDAIKQQLNQDFLTGDALNYTGQHQVNELNEIAINVTYQESETLFEAISQHPYAFFTDSLPGMTMLAVGAAAVVSYGVSKLRSK